MGKVDADRLLFKNRLRNRIRNDIAREFNLDSVSSTQRRSATDRVILAVQQGGVCPLCGNQNVKTAITPRMAAEGSGCEVAHIVPKGSGGHNGLSNVVLSHDKCNREMRRRTPRDYWQQELQGGFDEGIAWVEKIYIEIERPKPSEVKSASGNGLWFCYFAKRDDLAKLEQFKKNITDIQGMTQRQEAATKYASRQVMAYLADSLYEGTGLPERGGDRLIYANDGMWTSRLRREWGLFFDRHQFRAHGLTNEQGHERKEKDRGDHRHHAIDAIVIACCTRQVQIAWEEREKQADRDGINTADEQAMENYRRQHPLPLPAPFKTREDFRAAVEQAVFGNGEFERAVSHRPVKRKLIGALHKATQYGQVMDTWVQGQIVHCEPVPGRTTIRQDILGEAPTDFLKPAHLRLPRPETNEEAVGRLARRLRIGKRELSLKDAIIAARKLVKSKAFAPRIVDPKPEKGGIVRDVGLRRLLRQQLEKHGLNPDSYTKSELKKSIDEHGPLTHESGVPIHRVVLLWSNNDPVVVKRDRYDYRTGKRHKLDEPTTLRLYDSQNNHHIEIRVATNKNANEIWKGEVVSAFEVSKQLRERLRKLNEVERPFRHLRTKLTKKQKRGLSSQEIDDLCKQRIAEWKQAIRELKSQRKAIMESHPLVDRSDNDEKGGRFVMSLCEGEMLLMKHKKTGEVGYFVVAKINKRETGSNFEVVPHWDARSATERKDSEGKKVSDSKREQFAVTPSDLKTLAPPGHPHARKVRVSPLGEVVPLTND
ncbi:MAG: HNH endonuclease [Planctomycetia bacterium]|nr:HNH endonuclease [Planctomycetia bacterium]